MAKLTTGLTPPKGTPMVSEPEPAEEQQQEPESERASLRERRWVFGRVGRRSAAPGPDAPESEPDAGEGLVNLNGAGLEELRELGMSVIQAKAVIAYRERENGFDSVADLAKLPGFPPAFLAELKRSSASRP